MLQHASCRRHRCFLELIQPILDQIKRTFDVGVMPHATLVEQVRSNNYDVDKTVIALMELKKKTTSMTAGTRTFLHVVCMPQVLLTIHVQSRACPSRL